MEFNFTENADFKDILKRKQQEIFARNIGGIQDSEKFKRFHSALVSYLKESARIEFKLILITYEHLEMLQDDYYLALKALLDSNDAVLNNYLVINEKMEIVDKVMDHKYNNSNDVLNIYIELSDNFAVFLLQPQNKVSYFLKGKSYVDGVFLTHQDYISYEEKKSIDRIFEVFDEYRQHLSIRHVYSNFFISKSHLKSLHKDLRLALTEDQFITQYKHILENKPEDSFRENLRFYLKDKLKVNLLPKEYVLENFKRLDLFILDETGIDLYLIEVKWVGLSVHAEGKKLGTEYSADDINPAAIYQSVDYLETLYKNRQPIKLGFLVVYDARKENLPDTCQNIDETKFLGEKNMHFRKFKKIPDFRVVNLHPS